MTIGLLGALAGIGVPFLRNRPPPPREALVPSVAGKSSYLILATDSAAANYRKAIDTAKALHPDAAFGTFSPADLAGRARPCSTIGRVMSSVAPAASSSLRGRCSARPAN